MIEVALSHRFAGFALEVAFTAPGGVTALFGHSGSGKTTVVNAVAGLLRPDRGRVVVGGRVLADTDAGVFLPTHRRRVGYVFQDARLFPHLTVRQNLTYGRFFAPKGGEDFDRVVDLLGVGALLSRRPGGLSGGEKQRVAIGRALLSNPALLLMDEPLAALDEPRKAEILPFLETLRDVTRVPILYVSHSLAEVARLATTVVLLRGGQVAQSGPVAEVLADPASAAVVGPREAGAVLSVTVSGTPGEDGLTRLDSPGGPLWLSGITAMPGQALRLRIPASEVILSRAAPQGLSALNILAGRVGAIEAEGADAMVRIDLGGVDPGQGGGQAILARITRRSVAALGLEPGAEVHAIVKSVALAGHI